MSLRRRVVLACSVIVAVLLVADVALAGTFRSYLLGRLDQQLIEAATRIADAPRPPRRDIPDREPGRTPPRSDNPALSEYFIARADAKGDLVELLGDPLSSPAEAVPQLDPQTVVGAAAPQAGDLEPFIAASDDGDRWRMVAVDTSASAAPIVLVGASLVNVDATFGRMVVVLLIATVAVLATVAAIAWWLLRHGVRPLATMAVTAGEIADGALSQRVPQMDPRTEAGQLGVALNVMLGRIEDAFRERAASEERLRQFVADASHELRTPLTSVRGYAELYLAGGLDDDAALDDAMHRVEQEAARMSDLVDDLLLLAKLDEGRPMQRQPVRLDLLVRDAVRDARAVQPQRTITCETEPVEVVGDDARLRQAVANLLVNARTHTPVTAELEVRVRADGSQAVVEVADDGPGMPADVAGRVFERFFRADAGRARASGGSGLGLAIVAGIAVAHDGAAQVESSPGAGTRFRLRLPLQEHAVSPTE